FNLGSFGPFMAPFKKGVEGKGIAFGFDSDCAIGLVEGRAFHAQLVGYGFRGEPEVDTLYLAGYEDVEVFVLACFGAHGSFPDWQKYMQIITSTNPLALQQSNNPIEPVTDPDLVGGVADAAVQRLAARVELIAVAQSDAREVELRHAGQLPVAAGVEPDAEHTLHEEQRRGLRLRPQALRVRHQHTRAELEVRTQVE